MASAALKQAPDPTLRRLPAYLRILKRLAADGVETASCTGLAKETGNLPIQVRKDLAATGITGKPGVGYRTLELIRGIQSALGWETAEEAVLVGSGGLARAVLGVPPLHELGLTVTAVFDDNPHLTNIPVLGHSVLPLDRLTEVVEENQLRAGILAVPETSAQRTAERMVDAGLSGIWNFTTAALHLPPHIVVEDLRISSSLAVFTRRLQEALVSDQK